MDLTSFQSSVWLKEIVSSFTFYIPSLQEIVRNRKTTVELVEITNQVPVGITGTRSVLKWFYTQT